MKENIFDYNLSAVETEIINSREIDRETYLKITPGLKILSDLHLLFLIRDDKENCRRIVEKIRNFKEDFQMRSVII